MAKILKDGSEIRQWVEARGGHPLRMDPPVNDPSGIPLLQLTFDQHALNADQNEGPDRMTPGFELSDWDDWLETLREQNLVVVVDDDLSAGRQIDYRIMSREE